LSLDFQETTDKNEMDNKHIFKRSLVDHLHLCICRPINGLKRGDMLFDDQ
jgi:hypothetical protein